MPGTLQGGFYSLANWILIATDENIESQRN